jgi:hypothetical protein
MAYYDETEAQQRFKELLERALDGEIIIITCNGIPLVAEAGGWLRRLGRG